MPSPATTQAQIKSVLSPPNIPDPRRSNDTDSGNTFLKFGPGVAAGTTTTLICTHAEAEGYRRIAGNGLTYDLYDSTETVKASGTGKTITSVALNTPSLGRATVTFAAAAGGNTAAGDYFVRAGANVKDFSSIDNMDARIIALGGAVYAGAAGLRRLSQMGENDKKYVLNLLENERAARY